MEVFVFLLGAFLTVIFFWAMFAYFLTIIAMRDPRTSIREAVETLRQWREATAWRGIMNIAVWGTWTHFYAREVSASPLLVTLIAGIMIMSNGKFGNSMLAESLRE